MNDIPKKSLGQHWLRDPQVLEAIVDLAMIEPADTVLEIGPGLGTLTHYLARQARHVVAVEFDEVLAAKLPQRVQAANLSVVQEDILKFDLLSLPDRYKVVANIPYYLTSNLLRVLSESLNPPRLMVLLVQKEVAERICAKPGQMSLLSVAVQLDYSCELGPVVPADMFEPPPKVDSQVVVLRQHFQPLFKQLDRQLFFRVVKAGFSERRKKVRSSLAAGLHLEKGQVDQILLSAEVNGDLRAQNLSLAQWHRIYIEVAAMQSLRNFVTSPAPRKKA
ncbi:MAG TPA: 16S rRNA (adenine(1518)-N(6)/adenine(1519)-N(6))-dimethyltransferase RsmA [Candidatus Saccharimonadales bacterium]|nr:16S rRNA (adenine(1518)-N(6)/adenine(1519)-N(6))-dimethyltransferase RsmA [Candidatus Saccharimonadales bacterium]